MTSDLPDPETVCAAVALACRAPSVHNSQPWRWTVSDRQVRLYADWSRQLRTTDPDGRDLVVSCGAALHHLRAALSAMGWAGTVHRVPDSAQPALLATVEPHAHAAKPQDIMTSAAIAARRNDRRRFSSYPVPPVLLSRLADLAAEEGVVLRAATNPAARFDLFTAIAKAEQLQQAAPGYRDELASWSGCFLDARDGVPTPNIPASATVLAARGVRHFPGGQLVQPVRSWADGDGATLLVLGTTSDDTLSRLRAGEALSAVLLEATILRLASCVVSQPLEIHAMRDLVRARVLHESLFPQLVLRLGWSELSSPPLPRTPRRPVADVLTP